MVLYHNRRYLAEMALDFSDNCTSSRYIILLGILNQVGDRKSQR